MHRGSLNDDFRDAPCRQWRAAFTLFEIVLVLSVLAVVVSLTWPSLIRYMQEQEILEGAEAARAAAASTRIKAIDTGLTYQFRYEPDGRRFCVVPFDPPDTLGSSASDPGTDTGVSTYPVLSGKIGEQSQFIIPEEEPAVRESIPRESFANLPEARELESTTWGPPILFYPDGTAADATFRIVDEGNRRVDLALRGLTGTLRVSPLIYEADD